jgi:hypothetical protein
MTGAKIATYTILTAGGLSTAMTGVILGSISIPMQAFAASPTGQEIVTNVSAAPAISSTTPVTMALMLGGMSLAATFGWKISRAWSQMESKQQVLEERLAQVEDKCYRGAGCPIK